MSLALEIACWIAHGQQGKSERRPAGPLAEGDGCAPEVEGIIPWLPRPPFIWPRGGVRIMLPSLLPPMLGMPGRLRPGMLLLLTGTMPALPGRLASAVTEQQCCQALQIQGVVVAHQKASAQQIVHAVSELGAVGRWRGTQ